MNAGIKWNCKVEGSKGEKKEMVGWRKRRVMEILRTVCSGLLTVLLAVRIKVASHFYHVQLLFPTFTPSQLLSWYNSPPCLYFLCHFLPPPSPPTVSLCSCHINRPSQSAVLFSQYGRCEIKWKRLRALFDKPSSSFASSAIQIGRALSPSFSVSFIRKNMTATKPFFFFFYLQMMFGCWRGKSFQKVLRETET